MSRVGQRPITVPDQVKVEVREETVQVEGPKGKLSHRIPSGISVDRSDGRLLVKRSSEEKRVKSLHGLTRTLVDNMVKGVTEGFIKELEIQGVGFRAQVNAGKLEMYVGFTHPIVYPIPSGITIETPKPTQMVIKGIDKALVGQVAARLRSFAPPEPYKGKGIRYAGEVVRRKAGKAVA
ncbi:MAG: 50S ribosomal protein L6 [Candidatus Omnitrophica bacterium]|nr:50S ribosomal protein L6 [Candidatus Omnitrophota bacterium]